MNVVVIGDIGWHLFYHLGDEAMTEAAIDMLRSRGIDDITLVAGEPEVAQSFYGLPAVRRVRFKAHWSRARNEWRLADVARVLAEKDWDDHPIYPAIRDADAVLIAGGGNMNSRDYHLLFERVAVKRIAQHFSTPLYVTSQTVGPTLSAADTALVAEIADYAEAFGCRESTTAALMREHAAQPERIFLTLDDATALTADKSSRSSVDALVTDKPFVVASFTQHHGSIWPDRKTYYGDLAAACTEIADHNDVQVLLVPHAGTFADAELVRDQKSNARIAATAQSPRITPIRMLSARENIALIERSALSLSTRYHPTVFGPAAGVPTIGIAPSYYSSVRMRGSMRNVGLERFVLPVTSMHLLGAAAAEAIAKDPALTTALSASRDHARSFQHAWWDALCEAMRGGRGVRFSLPLDPPAYGPQGAWSTANESIVPVFDKYAQTVDQSRALARALEDERANVATLEADLLAVNIKLQRHEARVTNKIRRRASRLARRMRPNSR